MTILRGASGTAICDTAVLASIRRVSPPDVLIGCRKIQADDDRHLLPEEQRVVASRDPAARRASGAARYLARALISGLVGKVVAIGRGSARQPIWPPGITGSIAHDDDMAVVAVSSSSDIAGLGVDVEPSEPMPFEVASLVMSSSDCVGTIDPEIAPRLVFAVKEAIYKATFPLDGVVLNFEDIMVDLPAAVGWTRHKRMLSIAWCLSPRIIALAVIRTERRADQA